jgi:hypothetical protein
MYLTVWTSAACFCIGSIVSLAGLDLPEESAGCGFLDKPQNCLPAFGRRHLKQHVRPWNPDYFSVGSNCLKIPPAAFRHKIIAESAQIQNRLAKETNRVLLIGPEHLSNTVRNNTGRHTPKCRLGGLYERWVCVSS